MQDLPTTLPEALQEILALRAQVAELTHQKADARRSRVPPEAQLIIDRICVREGMTERELFSADRRKPFVQPRQEIWWRIRQLRNPMTGEPYSYPTMAHWFGWDHGTIIHGVQQFEKRLLTLTPIDIKPLVKQAA